MSKTKVITGEVRFSFLHVFEPYAMEEGQKEKYSASLIISKDDKQTLAKIDKAIEAALEEGKAKFGGKIPARYKSPLRDGDIDRPDDEAYQNSMFINANNYTQPGLVDKNLDPILNREDMYSGCYGRASITFYAFNVSGNRGIAVGLNHLMKTRDAEPLSGSGSTAAEDFGKVSEDDLM